MFQHLTEAAAVQELHNLQQEPTVGMVCLLPVELGAHHLGKLVVLEQLLPWRQTIRPQLMEGAAVGALIHLKEPVVLVLQEHIGLPL